MKTMTRTIVLAAAIVMALGLVTQTPAVTVVTYHPDQTQYGSGWTDSTSKYDGSIRWSSSSAGRGWIYFQVNSPQWPADSVKLDFLEAVDTGNCPFTFRVVDPTVNPLTAQPGILYHAIYTGFTAGYDRDSDTVPCWHHDTLNTAQWRPPYYPPGTFTCIGFYAPFQPSTGGAGWADGWGTGNSEPTLDFFYHP
jgi:hypothetical protein